LNDESARAWNIDQSSHVMLFGSAPVFEYTDR